MTNTELRELIELQITPGPWKVVGTEYGWRVGYPRPGNESRIDSLDSESCLEAEANCRAMAAVPELLAELSRLSEENERYRWQPIENAPKDGTIVDVWVPDEDGGHRVPDAYWGTAHIPWSVFQEKTGWCAANLGIDGADGPVAWDDDDLEPTHWRPRPESPSTTLSGSQQG